MFPGSGDAYRTSKPLTSVHSWVGEMLILCPTAPGIWQYLCRDQERTFCTHARLHKYWRIPGCSHWLLMVALLRTWEGKYAQILHPTALRRSIHKALVWGPHTRPSCATARKILLLFLHSGGGLEQMSVYFFSFAVLVPSLLVLETIILTESERKSHNLERSPAQE